VQARILLKIVNFCECQFVRSKQGSGQLCNSTIWLLWSWDSVTLWVSKKSRHTHAHTHTHIYTHKHTHTNAHTFTNKQIHSYTHTHAHTHTKQHTSTHPPTNKHTNTRFLLT